MKTTTIKIKLTDNPEIRSNFISEIEAICDDYDAECNISEEY